MPNSIKCPTCTASKLNQVFIYLKMAEENLEKMNMLNGKIESDFYSIMCFCKEKLKETLFDTKKLISEVESNESM